MGTPAAQPSVKRNTLSFVSFILALVSAGLLVLGFLLAFLFPSALLCSGAGLLIGPVALILGIIGLVQVNRSAGAEAGKGMAITGIVIGAITVLLICLSPVLATAILMILGPAIGNVFSTINQSLQTVP